MREARVAIIALVALFVTFVLPVPGPIGPVGAQQPTPRGTRGSPEGGKKVKQTAVITMEKGGEIALEFFRRTRPRRWRTS